MAGDVTVRDAGLRRALARAAAIRSVTMQVGIFRESVAEYANVHEHREGWKSKADQAFAPKLAGLLAGVRDEILFGSRPPPDVIAELGSRLVEAYRETSRELGLVDTGAMLEAVEVRFGRVAG